LRKEAQRKDVKSIGDVLIGSPEVANKLGMSRTKLNHFVVQFRLIVQYRVHESDFFAERKYGVLRQLSYRKLVTAQETLGTVSVRIMDHSTVINDLVFGTRQQVWYVMAQNGIGRRAANKVSTTPSHFTM